MKKIGIVVIGFLACAVLAAGVRAETISARVVDGPNVNVVEPVPEQPAAPMQEASDTRPVSVELWGGLGALSGDVTYQIGGAFADASGPGQVNSPLSELKWPLDVMTATVGGTVNIVKFWEVNAQWTAGYSGNAGLLQDSDWEDPAHPSQKTTASLSDTDFDGFSTDVGLRCWALNWVWDAQTGTAIGLGAGWILQDFNWKASNLDQWSPSDPGAPHEIVPGRVGTYKVNASMPYVEVACETRMPWVSLFGSLGFSPDAQIKDEDDHAIRSILAKTDASGTAVKLALQGRFDYNQYVFGLIRGDFIAYNVDGTEHDFVYGGPDAGDSWSIHHDISSIQDNFTIAVGVKF